MYDAPYPTRSEEKNNLSPPPWRRALQQLPNNDTEDSSIDNTEVSTYEDNNTNTPEESSLELPEPIRAEKPEHVLPGGKTISQLKEEFTVQRKATYKTKLQHLETKPLPQLLEQLHREDLKTLIEFLEVMQENPTASGMLETTIQRVIDEKKNGIESA